MVERFIEIGSAGEELDEKTKSIIKQWEMDGWLYWKTEQVGDNRQSMWFRKEAATAS